MKLQYVCWKLATLLVLCLTPFTRQDDGSCGLSAPDPAKTCISLRLPWKSKPLYFCVDKPEFKYRNQCQGKFSSNCGQIRNDSLLMATPWECCPHVSNPDSCGNHKCPPPPYNRKCQVIPPNDNNPWECCPKYFCEENLTPEMCHFKLLESGCNVPPAGKSNCVAFNDEHGCCPKYQCDGDTRPGLCPAEADAKKYMTLYNTTKKKGPEYHEIHPKELHPHHSDDADEEGLEAHGFGGGKRKFQKKVLPHAPFWPPRPPLPRPPSMNRIACVGDFNCPGTMKCCSSDMHVYIHEGHYLQKNKNPTGGFCLEPAANNGTKKD